MSTASDATVVGFTAVGSSCIDRVAFDWFTQAMVVVLRNGNTYQYEGVDLDTYSAFWLSKSCGTYWNEKIKGKYGECRLP